MNEHLVALGPPAAAALVISALMTSLLVPIVRGVAMGLHAVDYPGGRRDHGFAVARLGGVAIVLGVVIGVGGIVLIEWPARGHDVTRSVLAVWMLGSTMVFIVGLVEDVIGVSPLKRLLVESAAAWLIVAVGWKFNVIALPILGDITLGWVGGALTIVWIVGVTNAVNLLDGLDGLAAGVIAIISGSVAVLAAVKGDFFSVVLLFGIVGASVAFLRHNWSPATIFLGDAGSLTLGFVLATLTVHGALKSSAAVAILVPILALGIPVIDTLLVMAVRFLSRSESGFLARLTGMFVPDRGHLHHLLLGLASHRAVVVRWIYLAVLISCGGALVVALTKSATLGFVLVVVEIVVVFLVRRLGLARRATTLGAALRREVKEELQAQTESNS